MASSRSDVWSRKDSKLHRKQIYTDSSRGFSFFGTIYAVRIRLCFAGGFGEVRIIQEFSKQFLMINIFIKINELLHSYLQDLSVNGGADNDFTFAC